VGVAFLEVVRARWPQWLAHATVDARGSLVLEVPSPHRGVAEPLRIAADAYLDEVVIGFAGGRAQSGGWRDAAAADHDFVASQRLLDDLLAERAVACIWRDGAGAIGRLDELRSIEWWWTVRSVRSWNGSHDWTAAERSRRMYLRPCAAGSACVLVFAAVGWVWPLWLFAVAILAGVCGYWEPTLRWRAGAALVAVQPIVAVVLDFVTGEALHPARSTGGLVAVCIGSMLMAFASPLPVVIAHLASRARARTDARHCPPPWASARP